MKRMENKFLEDLMNMFGLTTKTKEVIEYDNEYQNSVASLSYIDKINKIKELVTSLSLHAEKEDKKIIAEKIILIIETYDDVNIFGRNLYIKAIGYSLVNRKILELMATFFGDSKVMEIGAGSGYMTYLLKNYCNVNITASDLKNPTFFRDSNNSNNKSKGKRKLKRKRNNNNNVDNKIDNKVDTEVDTEVDTDVKRIQFEECQIFDCSSDMYDPEVSAILVCWPYCYLRDLARNLPNHIKKIAIIGEGYMGCTDCFYNSGEKGSQIYHINEKRHDKKFYPFVNKDIIEDFPNFTGIHDYLSLYERIDL